jgi:hypothetical protein
MIVSLIACKNKGNVKNQMAKTEKADSLKPDKVQTAIGPLILPPPYATKSVAKVSSIVGWEEGQTPKAPDGFKVSRFADDLDHPRNLYVAPNGNYFVAESNDPQNSADQIRLLRDTNGDGEIDERHVFLENLNQPYGMLILNGYFYVGNVDGVVRFPYKEGQTKIEEEGEEILKLPAGGYNHHWTRNLIANEDGSKIYITVGSSSNVGEHGMEKEKRRANILQINPDGSGEIIFASGLRNPVGIDWNPANSELWTAVNERDKLGDNLVPDYITSVKKDGFYGWPYSYFGQIKDPRWKEEPHQKMVDKAIVPDVPVGSHTASLGLEFYNGNQFPTKYKNGAFVGQHGSWNRSKLAGYKVLFVPFENGKPQKPQDFLTGFLVNENGVKAHGRPVAVSETKDGSLLVNDDDGGVIWKVSAK